MTGRVAAVFAVRLGDAGRCSAVSQRRKVAPSSGASGLNVACGGPWPPRALMAGRAGRAGPAAGAGRESGAAGGAADRPFIEAMIAWGGFGPQQATFKPDAPLDGAT